MALTYSDKPQLHYGKRQEADWRERFSSHARPITTVSERAAAPITVYEPDGRGYRVMPTKGSG